MISIRISPTLRLCNHAIGEKSVMNIYNFFAIKLCDQRYDSDTPVDSCNTIEVINTEDSDVIVFTIFYFWIEFWVQIYRSLFNLLQNFILIALQFLSDFQERVKASTATTMILWSLRTSMRATLVARFFTGLVPPTSKLQSMSAIAHVGEKEIFFTTKCWTIASGSRKMAASTNECQHECANGDFSIAFSDFCRPPAILQEKDRKCFVAEKLILSKYNNYEWRASMTLSLYVGIIAGNKMYLYAL